MWPRLINSNDAYLESAEKVEGECIRLEMVSGIITEVIPCMEDQ